MNVLYFIRNLNTTGLVEYMYCAYTYMCTCTGSMLKPYVLCNSLPSWTMEEGYNSSMAGPNYMYPSTFYRHTVHTNLYSTCRHHVHVHVEEHFVSQQQQNLSMRYMYINLHKVISYSFKHTCTRLLVIKRVC